MFIQIGTLIRKCRVCTYVLRMEYQIVVGLRLFINQISLCNYGIQEQTTELVLFSHNSKNQFFDLSKVSKKTKILLKSKIFLK